MKHLKLIFACLLTAIFSIGQVWGEDATLTLDKLGTGLTSTSNTTVETTDITASGASTAVYTLNYLGGKKQGDAILLAKGSSGGTSFISNKTAMPGDIQSVTVYINSGASGSATYHCAFNTSECTSRYVTGSTAQNITGGNNKTYTCSVSGARYFCVALGANYNGQVLKVDVTYTAGETPDPSVSLSPSSLDLDAENVANQSVTITASNFASAISSVTTGLYSDAECATPITSGAWVKDITVNAAKTAVTFNVDDNETGVARECWLKVSATDGTGNASAAVHIAQKKIVVDYATLPFSFTGGKSDIETTDGMTQSGLGSDYSATEKLRFDNTGDWLKIKINADPGKLSYQIKGNSFSGGTFTIQQSADDETYSDLATYTADGSVELALVKTTRYVKFIYTNKSSGNIGLGNIAISEYVAPTACEAPTFTPGAGETFTETLDVVLTSATPGATVYYTLDGSEPTTASSVFGEKITLTETTTINAIAVKDGLSNSSVASATFTKVIVIDSYDIDFETNDLAPYVNWNFSNISIVSTEITAHGGTYYGNTEGKASASITTKEKVANPGTLTFWTSKESGNTTASYWTVEVSEDGSDWTEVESFSATTGNKGTWTEREADLSDHTNVYVRISYGSSTAVRAIDDISLEMAAAVKKPVISGTETFLTSTEVSITCATTSATIYYTIDGTDPKTSESKQTYSAAFNVFSTTTVRAIAKLDEDWSAEATSKTFTKIDVVNVATALDADENDEVYVQGTITSITEVNLDYKNATYVISDMSAGLPQNEMIVYRGKYVDGADFTSADQIHIGDVVVVSGTIGVHDAKNQLAAGNQIETISAPAVAAPAFTPDGGGFMGEASLTITSATEGAIVYYTLDGTTPSNASLTAQPIVLTATTTIKAIAIKDEENSMVVSKTFTLSEPMTVAAALDALDSEDPINNVAVAGIISTAPTSNPSSGKLTYYISDDGTDIDELEVFLGFGLNGASFSAKTDLQVGDEVTVFGNLTIFNSTTKEFASGSRLLAFNRPVAAVTGVEVDETATVKVNKTVQLTANVLPVNATNKNVSWSVKAGSEAYAEVSASGLVTGKAQGTAIIVVTTEDGGFTDECTVTVNPGPPANTDILTAEEIGVGSSYDDWSGNGFGTSSEYAGNSMTATGDYAGAIQLRSKENSGIVLTASNGLYLKNLSVTVKSGTNTLNVYAKNSAYTSTADLYNEETRGTLIGTVSATGAMTLEEGISYNDNYQYIGLRSANGALYLSDITITWGEAYVPTVTFDAPENGTLVIKNGENVISSGAAFESGTVLTVETAPNAGYNPAVVTINGEPLVGNSFTVGTEDITVAASFEAVEEGVVYSVSGNSLAIFNRIWEPYHPHHYTDLFRQEDGTYMRPIRQVTLPKGEIQYLVVKNRDFANGSWPANTATLVVPSDGIYDVTFTFNPTTKAVGATLDKLQDITITRPVYINGSWNPSTTLRVPEGDYHDKVVIWLSLVAGDYTFRMTDKEGKSYGDGQEFSRDAASYVGLTLGNGDELILHADVKGEYIFTYEFEAERLFITYPTQVPAKKIEPLAGKFSIGDGEQVQFSRGNLLYNIGEDAWFAAEKQTQTLGDANLRFGDNNFKGTIDMFGWSSADSNFGLRRSNDNADYTNSEFVDWGGKFADDDYSWSTLSYDEWNYLLNRTKDSHKLWTMAGLKQGVDTVFGILLFPDDWTAPAGITVNYGIYPNGDDTYQLADQLLFTDAEWAQLEAAGAVLMPFAGSRTGFWGNRNDGYGNPMSTAANPLMPNDSMYCWFDEVNNMGYYWTSTQAGQAYQVATIVVPGWVDSKTVEGDYVPGHYLPPTKWNREKRRGQSVRLVTRIPNFGSYQRNVTNGNYGTICLPKAGTIEGATLYEIAYYDGAKIYLDEVTTGMAAGTPYIFQATAAQLNVTYTSDEQVDSPSEQGVNGLYGFYDLTDASAKKFLDQDGTNYILYQNQYWLVNNSAYIENYRAYIKVGQISNNASAPAAGHRRIAMTVNGEQTATGIDALNASETPVKVLRDGQIFILRGEKMYDVTGQMVK